MLSCGTLCWKSNNNMVNTVYTKSTLSLGKHGCNLYPLFCSFLASIVTFHSGSQVDLTSVVTAANCPSRGDNAETAPRSARIQLMLSRRQRRIHFCVFYFRASLVGTNIHILSSSWPFSNLFTLSNLCFHDISRPSSDPNSLLPTCKPHLKPP